MTQLGLQGIESSLNLTKLLSVEASASFLGGLFGASAEVKISQNQDINSYYTYSLVQVNVINPPRLLRNPRLKDAARDVLVEQGWQEFAAQYGWEYIEGVITGGSYYALIEIQTTNEVQQQNVKTKLGAYYGLFKLSGEVETALKEATKDTATNVYVAQSGGVGDPVETTLDAMIQQARDFAAIAEKEPVSIAAITADYRGTVPLPSGVPAPDSLPRRRRIDTLTDLGNEYLKLRDYRANLAYVLDHLADFDDFRELDEQQLQEKRQEYQSELEATAAEINNVTQQASRCSDNISQCETYTPTIHPKPLPRIGGELMNMKQMEEQLAALRDTVSKLSTGGQHFSQIVVKQTPAGASDPNSSMGWIVSTKQQPPYLNWAHDRNGAEPAKRYGYIQGGDYGNSKQFVVQADREIKSRLNLASRDLVEITGEEQGVFVSGPRLSVQGDLLVNGEIRGNLRLIGQYTWHQGQPHTRMCHSSEGIAVLSAVQGKFEGGGEMVNVYRNDNDGYWYLGGRSGQSGVYAEALCYGK